MPAQVTVVVYSKVLKYTKVSLICKESQLMFGILLYFNMDAFRLVNKNTCGVPATHHISYCMWLHVTIKSANTSREANHCTTFVIVLLNCC